MVVCFGSFLVHAEETDQTYTGTYEKVAGKDLASVRYYLTDETDYAFAEVTETETGYSYTFTAPAGEYTIVPEYFSTTVWDGAVDISWYDSTKSAFYLSNGAQLAGLSAIVSGQLDANTADYRVKGDLSLLEHHETVISQGADGSGGDYTVEIGEAKNSFLGKVIYLTADIDLGGNTQYTNWMPIGGMYPQDTQATDIKTTKLVTSYFQGSIDGQGHKITNLYCDRYARTNDFFHSQGIGFIGHIGGYYADETVGELFVRNLSVDGYVYGRRMVGGIIGRMGDTASAIYVENCVNHADVVGTDSKGQGGIVGAGWANDGAIINCYNTGSVTNDTYVGYGGGIVGNNDNLDIINCYNVGTIYVTGNRGRAIGTHDSGVYLIEDCFYLEGCDNAPADDGYYKGGYTGTANITAYSETFMKSLDFVSYLNTNGTAFVYNEGGYPQLLWEAGQTGTANVTVENPQGGTIISSRSGSLPYGAVLHFSNTEETGWSFRTYTVNGKIADTGYYTVAEESVVVSGTFESMQAGVLNIEYSDAAVLTVTKDGTVMVDGVATAVTAYPVNSGDPLYESDVLYVTAEWREGAYPTDPNLVYKGMNNMSSSYKYSFTYTGGADKFSTTAKHTVTSDITNEGVTLTLKVQPQTTNKTWTDRGVYDISWYEGNEDAEEYTLTNAHQLAGAAYLVTKKIEDFRGQTIKLGANINLANDDGTTGVRHWPGMSGSSTSFYTDNADGTYTMNDQFRGTFDGCGYMVYNMTAVTSSSYGGFFRSTYGATIKNLTVSGTATASSYIGGIVAYGHTTTISNCRSYVNISGGTTSGSDAGILSYARASCVIENCINYGTINTAKGGGIFGTGYGSSTEADVTITDCINYGYVGGRDASTSGGLGGIAGQFKTLYSMTRCANYGTVSGANWYVGGLIGDMVGGSTAAKVAVMTDCYNAGKVENINVKYGSSAAGGLIGCLSYGVVSNSFNYGNVNTVEGFAGVYVGALVGRDYQRAYASVTNTYFRSGCYIGTKDYYEYDGVKYQSGTPFVADSYGYTTEQFASADFLTELNVNSCYTLAENAAHPELAIAAGSGHTHSGGDATCNALAICESCYMPYGEYDAEDHTGNLTELRNAVDPLWTTNGYSGDTHCVGCDAVLVAGEVLPVDLTAVVLTVNEQDADGKIISTKTYTASDLNALNEKCNTGALAYQYWQTNSDTGEVTTKFAVHTKYATLDALFADAGITFGAGDNMVINDTQTYTWEKIDAEKYYFKSTETDSREAVVVAPSIGFCAEMGTEPETVDDIAAAAKITGSLRLGYGASVFGESAGARLVSGVTTITIQHTAPAYTLGDVNKDGEVNTLDALMLIQYCNETATLDATALLAADVNKDGEVDVQDALMLIQFCNELIDSF